MVAQRHVAALLLVVLVASSGCVGFVTGQSPLTFSADSAKTSPDAAEDAGYELNDTRSQTIERDFEVAGTTRTVKATNQIAMYDKSVSIPLVGSAKVGVFAVISTPAVEIGPKTFNPIGDYSNEELVNMFADRYGKLNDVNRAGSQSVTALGSKTSVGKFEATTTFQGQELDVYILVTKIQHGDDYVVALGVYPQRLDGETKKVVSMIRALEHPA